MSLFPIIVSVATLVGGLVIATVALLKRSAPWQSLFYAGLGIFFLALGLLLNALEW